MFSAAPNLCFRSLMFSSMMLEEVDLLVRMFSIIYQWKWVNRFSVGLSPSEMWSPGEAEDRELHAKIHHHFLVVFKEIISEFLIPVLLFSNRFCSCLIC